MREVRVMTYVTKEEAAALKERAATTGVPTAEFLRRAIRLAEFADRKVETR
jgi:hypothetical protein